MPSLDSKSLFHAKTLNNALRTFQFPADLDDKHQVIQRWIETLNSGTLGGIKEVSLHGAFLNDIFQTVLGYHSVTQGNGANWEIDAEPSIAGRGAADAALGFFTPSDRQIIAPIELKGAMTDLDRGKSRNQLSPVDQGWSYADYISGCQWVIVSNYRETRLYHRNETKAYYERFLLADLADREVFKRFYYLLCRQNFLPTQSTAVATSAIDRLLKESKEAQEEITDQLYGEYSEIRQLLVNDFIRTQQTAPQQELLMIEKAQKLLDRVLFIAFCEDRGLLPKRTLEAAYAAENPYNPQPIWKNYTALFRWIDRGNSDRQPPIPGYNGGLFQADPILDEQISVPDLRCKKLKELTRYDFDTEISVDILGHIFEQSITDLEKLKAEKTGQDYGKQDEKKGKRKSQGIYYTPAWVTQYIVEAALGGYLKQQDQRIHHQLADQVERSPQLSETDLANRLAIEFWQTYQQMLNTIRVIDPACGSGAFLIAAFDYLMQEQERVNLHLEELGIEGQDLANIDRTILTQNLFGVDLSSESVEITKLSLWLKTAVPGKTLTDLDHNIKVGNSIVADAAVTERAFDWQREFPDVFASGGFDVAIGNPPYVRQELLSPIKPYLQQHYASYDGVADLYTYFYERGLTLLKANGILSYIVTNKWLRAGYGEALRRFFSENSVFEQIIDFGHAPIFQDADTFPCIVVARRVEPNPPAPFPSQERGAESLAPVIICPVPREKLAGLNLSQYIQQEGYDLPWSRFTANAWSLEPPAVDELMAKIKRVGVPLKDFAGVKPYRGILTGFNEAFLIDDETKNRLVQADPKSADIIKPYLRGQDVRRWRSEWQNIWMIFTRRGINIDSYPAIKAHLNTYKEQLEPRPKDWDTRKTGDWKGRKPGSYKWYEIQDSIDYWQLFEQTKIVWKDLSTYSEFCFDDSSVFTNDLCFILPTTDKYLLAILNSPVMWYYLFRTTIHGVNETLRLKNIYTETLPIAPPTDEVRSQVKPKVSRLIELTKANQESYRDVLDWMRSRFRIEKPGQKLESFANLDRTQFIDEVRDRIPKAGRKGSDPLGVAGQKEVSTVYNDYALPIQQREREILTLEHELSDLVNQAYGLTPEEIDLMWKTAPPRMPIKRMKREE